MKKVHIVFIVILCLLLSAPVETEAKFPKFFSTGLKDLFKGRKDKKTENKQNTSDNSIEETDTDTDADPMAELTEKYPELANQLALMMDTDPDYAEELMDIVISNPDTAKRLNEFYRRFPSYKIFPFSENELEWNEFKDKKASAQITVQGLLLKNDNKQSKENQNNEFQDLIYTYTDLPLNLQADFVISTTMRLPKFEKGHPYAILFNLEDKFNSGIISFDSETVRYLQLKDGRIVSEQSVLINGKKSKNTIARITIEKTGGKIIVSVNDDPCLKIRKIDYQHSGFGFGAYPESSFTVQSVGCGMGAEDFDE